MKIIKIILAVLFGLFAIVQYNDPDPWLWIFIYGITAVVFVANLLGWYNNILLLLLIIAAVIYSFTYIDGVIEYFGMGDPGAIVESMKVDKPYIEETREFFGMWLVIAALWFLYRKGNENTSRAGAL
jgi:hypothetical protein